MVNSLHHPLFYFMKKDAFYFPHFSDASKDRKIMRLEKELGLEGYAIYFKLLEVLRQQNDFKYPLSEIDLLADDFKTSEQKVRVVICNYNLFQVDDNEHFFSLKQIYYLQPYIEKTSRARQAAIKRWEKTNIENANSDANAMQMHSPSNAEAMQIKESKVKENKEKESKVNKSIVTAEPLVFVSPDWELLWQGWADYKKTEHRDGYKSAKTEQVAINKLVEMSGGDLTKAQEIVKQSIANRWKGLFTIKQNNNVTTKSNFEQYQERREQLFKAADEYDRQRGFRPGTI